jgi:phosphoribosylformylglycinamidine (FGAM) synthase PurS component
MHGTHIIEVLPKAGVKDPTGSGLENDVRHLGVKSVKKVRSSQLYRIVGDLASQDRARIARDLLTDPVTQEYRDGAVDLAPAKAGKSRSVSFLVDVWYKSGVTDVIGESVLKGIKDLKISSITEVRTGMRYRFEGLPNAQAAEKIALALLVNPLVNDQFVHAD